ncbi:MAG: tyrosine--tRNA ligase [Candidatus Hydrogenedentes bacterium]|nr:tyrosine--tRNA ligase [Candidatus Hydrogenedentota bacterium]
MSLIEELRWRGLLHQQTHDDLEARLAKEPITCYAGFDPTADSLHVGSMIPIIGLMHLQRAGHRPIILVGGGTGLIGDPSFKAAERALLTKEDVARNVARIQKQLEHFLDFTGPNAAVVRDNGDWLSQLPLIDFLRDIGKHFSVNAMLSKDSVRQRLEDRDHGISYTEFTYSLLQAYDFLALFEKEACRLQLGGSDQWGNIVAGIDLVRRIHGEETYGFTLPLVTKSDGSKFGKSETGNVWLDPARTSPYTFYQFWLNQADADTSRYLRFYTFLEHAAIEDLERQIAEEPHKRAAQRALAEAVTRMVHGDAALANAIEASEAMFSGDLKGLDEATLNDVFAEVPSAVIPHSVLGAGRGLIDVLVEAQVFPSKGEARRLIQNGGLYLNSERIDDAETPLNAASLLTGNIAIVRKGKKNYHLLRFE